ncbi:hypothetical protein [Paenibacillus lautus]|uniref:hypothetical protein n=1 Tax=Paenibacillus lautus TaxID=1401 RepID=UPI002DB557DB|nr:hypothetical protein [Paenibacillus lautus]MEC0253632.1 hypothetical protein [Paenibacillus lautus]
MLSLSAIFRISDDSNFGTMGRSVNQLRFSIFSLNLGPVIFSFISYGFWIGKPKDNGFISPKGFRWVYILRFSELIEKITESEHRRLKLTHRNFLENADPKHALIYKETLLYKIEQMKEKKASSTNKFLAYLAIIAFIIPLYIPSLLKFTSIFEKPTWVQVGYILLSVNLVIYVFNLVIFLGMFIKIKSVNRFKYGAVKKDAEPDLALINCYYLDFQHMKTESTNEVSYMANIENHIFGTLILSVVLLVFSITSTANFQHSIAEISSNKVYKMQTIDLTKSTVEVVKSIEIELANLKTELLNNNVKDVIIINYSKLENSNYQHVVKFIETYNVYKVRVTEIIGDDQLVDRLQIIYEGR